MKIDKFGINVGRPDSTKSTVFSLDPTNFDMQFTPPSYGTDHSLWANLQLLQKCFANDFDIRTMTTHPYLTSAVTKDGCRCCVAPNILNQKPDMGYHTHRPKQHRLRSWLI